MQPPAIMTLCSPSGFAVNSAGVLDSLELPACEENTILHNIKGRSWILCSGLAGERGCLFFGIQQS